MFLMRSSQRFLTECMLMTRRQLGTVVGQNTAHMIRHGSGNIKTFPAEQLGAPGDVGIFAIGEEVVVEEFAAKRNVVDHLAAVEAGGSGRAKYKFCLFVLRLIRFKATAIEVAHVGCDIDSGGIEDRRFDRFEIGSHGEEFAANAANGSIGLGGG